MEGLLFVAALSQPCQSYEWTIGAIQVLHGRGHGFIGMVWNELASQRTCQ